MKEYIKLYIKCVMKKIFKQSKMRKYQSFSISKKSLKKIIINFIIKFSKL